MPTKKKKTSRHVLEIGGAVTAAVLAAAAGAYLLSDKKTKTKAKAWIGKAKKEIAKHAKTAKKLGETEYNMIVDQVTKRYGSMENLTAGDVMMAAKDLKAQWNKIQQHAMTMAKKKIVKKPAAKKKVPAKKTSKKARA